ncbi:stage II sporulation protein M [Caldalkalibacillus thermarum TA2.A1]|uniref:Stage II sporulation protein M n=1 Tax=Caldalkalibacillus thermarum (strain TA2.A1) TaxID=986075 RepID=F5L869_CALTT|nr:stage II sporulation protein M [Caldalkalibacillus thermarum]EGL82482.1 stage II sporulation protein M [Caldalkalibacillus thermarum TA2.A1]QZT33170.1 stage II sporulation protein M [Caldalkalibacillus thermarum TA2.A1]GGK15165.1 stage II sporulation protein M [Caldalkalibacillus thermarum]
MKQKIGQVIWNHVQEHSALYLFITVLFVMGIIFGTLTVQSLGYAQQHELYTYFQQFLEQFAKENFVDPGYAFYQNFIHYVKYVGIIWVLGLSIIGLPVILIMVFLKGVFVGFTVGFLVHQMGLKGFLLSFVSVIPQNMVVVPLILMMSVISISFSLKLMAHLFRQNRVNRELSLAKYVSVMALAAVILVAVALFQTYFSPLLMRGLL